MRAYDIILKKRDGYSLTKQEIDFMIQNYTTNKIPDYQMAAFLMSIYFRSMSKKEIIWLTESMIKSGDVLDLKDIDKPKADKHSTGGVGDGISLSLAPLLASFDIAVPMMSGRALGHTGGTLDKLESIDGFNIYLTQTQIKKQLKKIGLAIFAANKNIVPADKKIYALRDVTATVESIPLISASIMSKKIAESIDALLLDVKTGNGAFIEKFSLCLQLAKTMVEIGKNFGIKTLALITDMNQPLGEYVGNSLEIYQTIKILKNEGPEDITELVLIETAKLLQLLGIEKNFEKAKQKAKDNLSKGYALEKFKELIIAQNGNYKILDKPQILLNAKYQTPIMSKKSGYITNINTKLLGLTLAKLGAGRQKLTDKIDHLVGIKVLKKLNQYVEKSEPLIYVFYNDKNKFEELQSFFLSCFSITEKLNFKTPPLVYKEIK
ncbi:MAG: thymidine phosphorylase [Endomicrobiia bacterium]